MFTIDKAKAKELKKIAKELPPVTKTIKNKVRVRGSLLRANDVNKLNSGERVESKKKYIGFAEKTCLVDHYSRIKKLYKEHGDNGVKVYVLEVLAEVDRRIKNHNMNDPKNKPAEEDTLPPAEQIEEEDVDDEFASDDLDYEDEEEEEFGGEGGED